MVKESIFNPDHQAGSVPSKVVAAMERLSQAFRVLLWNEAKHHGISSTIQIQLLTYLLYYPESQRTVTYLASYFNMTKATISDALKALESKGLIQRKASTTDTRSHSLSLTRHGKSVARKAEKFAHPMHQAVMTISGTKQAALLDQLQKVLEDLNDQGIITPQSISSNGDDHAVKGKNGNHRDLGKHKNLKLEYPGSVGKSSGKKR
jgi:DNA-binding MarR family transcriptional regulator